MTSQLSEPISLYDSEVSPDEQRDALTSGAIPVAVYGLGKMGLPLAAVYADVTGNVVGADVDPDVVEAVNEGRSHISAEPELDELVAETVAENGFEAVTEPREAADRASIHVVIVPTLVTEENDPDLSVVEAVARDIAEGLDPGDTVLFESTLPPRACRDVILPILERESGLERGEFGLAFCPERTKSGQALADIRGTHPKIVGGVDAESTRVAELVYGEITDNEVIPVADATTAESVKVFEGIYRDVNIALANELGRHAAAIGIDVLDAIDAANTIPVCDLHTPGAGVGGHCIPYYPYFLMQQFDVDTPLIGTAREVNESMPAYTAGLAAEGLDEVGVAVEDATVLVLGLTYRPEVEEIRATPALPIVEYFDDAGADVLAHDPVLSEYDAFESAGANVVAVGELDEVDVDAVVLVTMQPSFASIDVPSLGTGDRPLVVADGRQALTELRDDEAVRYRGVGLDD